MLKITLKGPVGSGKSRIIAALQKALDKMDYTHLEKEQATNAAIAKIKPDVLIETKVAR